MKRAITEKMDIIEENIQSQFTNLYCKKDFENALSKASSARPDRQPFILSKIARMIEETGAECKYGESLPYYQGLVSKLELPTDITAVNQKLADTLCEAYALYPKPGDFMERIVNSIAPEGALSESLRLRIFKRFLKTVNVKANKKYYSKTMASADVDALTESVFDSLDSGEKCDWLPLLQASHELANGIFISPVATKALLFMFAFAYGMQYYPSKGAKDYDVALDVEKNLFEDYYCDNLARYIYSEDGGKAGSSDTEPSGAGLNPKSFIDVVFIYYLNKNTLTPQEKITGFYTAVNSIKDLWKTDHDYIEGEKQSYESLLTGTYIKRLHQEVLGLEEDDLVEYMADHYYCDLRYPYKKKNSDEIMYGTKGIFELQLATNTAYTQYQEILDLIKDALGLDASIDLAETPKRVIRDSDTSDAFNKTYGDSDSITAVRLVELEANVPDAESEHFASLAVTAADAEKFSLIIKSVAKRLEPYNAIGVSDPMKMTRTKLIAAYYHYYCLTNESGLDDNQADMWTSFKDVYEDMGGCLNSYLEEAGYQPVSSKNLYDVFVIFFAYCKINNMLS